MIDRVGDAHEPRKEAGFLKVTGGETGPHLPQSRFQLLGDLPAVDFGKVLGLQNDHVFGREIHETPVGREHEARTFALMATGPRDRVHDFVPPEVVADDDARSDLEPVELLDPRLPQDERVRLLWIDGETPNPELLVPLAEREGVDGAAFREVDGLDV